MENKKANIGKNVYAQLKRNNMIVLSVVILAICSIGIMAFLALAIYQDSTNKLYTVNNKGDLIPLSLVTKKEDKIKVVQSSVDYFVKQLYELDQFSINAKKEKVLWLIGEQPTKIIKDKDAKGYYSNFMTINGLVQKSEILPDSWIIRNIDDNPEVTCSVLINRINGEVKEWYQADLQLRLANVNINYPYNPFGYIITNYAEQLKKVPPPTDEELQKRDSIQIAEPTLIR